ncbi:MAG: helix-turn-helix domain-containing protein [Pseudomonadota bacterium]
MIAFAITVDEGAYPNAQQLAQHALEAIFGPIGISPPVELARRMPDLLVRDIVRRVAYETGLTFAELIGACRSKRMARARFAVMWLASRHAGKSTTDIGRALCRDHTTVIHGLIRAKEYRASDPAFRLLTDKLAGSIESTFS